MLCKPPSHWHMIIALHFCWFVLLPSALLCSSYTPLTLTQTDTPLLSSEWMYCITAYHLLLFEINSFNYGGGDENGCLFCWGLLPPSASLKYNMGFYITCYCWSQWLHVRDSGCSSQTPCLNEFQSAVDEVIQTNLKSQIKEVSDKQKHANNLFGHLSSLHFTIINTDARKKRKKKNKFKRQQQGTIPLPHFQLHTLAAVKKIVTVHLNKPLMFGSINQHA